MKNRSLSFLALMLLAGITALLAWKVAPVFYAPAPYKYISLNDVAGVDVVHKNTPFTLNFDQQNAIIGLLDGFESVSLSSASQEQKSSSEYLAVQKIIIHRFKAADVTLTPLSLNESGNYIFVSKEWNEGGLLKDTSQGALREILSKTYDP